MSLLKPKVLILSKIFSFIFSDVNWTTQGGVAKKMLVFANDFWFYDFNIEKDTDKFLPQEPRLAVCWNDMPPWNFKHRSV
jgi:hypothetical protein